MAKLSKEDWEKARGKWERSSKDGFEWLAKEIGVARPVISRRAKSENWTKKGTQTNGKGAQKGTIKSTGALNVKNYEDIDLFDVKETGKYKTEYNEIAYNLSLAGFSLEQIADTFEVATQTVHEWRKRYKGFNNAILMGREIADGKIAKAFFDVALGRVKVVEERDVINPVSGEIETLETRKTVLPNVKALIHWMFNREKIKDYWSNGEGRNNDNVAELDTIEVIEAFNKSMEIAREKYSQMMANRRLEQGLIIESDPTE